MSLFVAARATCRQCQTATNFQLAASVNADRRPDLRQQIMDGEFQAEACPSCGAMLRLPVHLSYLDVGRGQRILAEDVSLLPRWRDVETEALSVFDRAFGSRAPKAAQELGTVLRPRLVLGWPALREALLTDAIGLDPVTLELLKIAILRRVPAPPLGDTTELRLIAFAADALEFSWMDGQSEQALTGLTVGTDAYRSISDAPAAWAPLRRELETSLFIDFRRLVFA